MQLHLENRNLVPHPPHVFERKNGLGVAQAGILHLGCPPIVSPFATPGKTIEPSGQGQRISQEGLGWAPSG